MTRKALQVFVALVAMFLTAHAFHTLFVVTPLITCTLFTIAFAVFFGLRLMVEMAPGSKLFKVMQSAALARWTRVCRYTLYFFILYATFEQLQDLAVPWGEVLSNRATSRLLVEAGAHCLGIYLLEHSLALVAVFISITVKPDARRAGRQSGASMSRVAAGKINDTALERQGNTTANKGALKKKPTKEKKPITQKANKAWAKGPTRPKHLGAERKAAALAKRQEAKMLARSHREALQKQAQDLLSSIERTGVSMFGEPDQGADLKPFTTDARPTDQSRPPLVPMQDDAHPPSALDGSSPSGETEPHRAA